MKRTLWGILGIGIAVVALILALQAQEKRAVAQPNQDSASQQPASGTEQVVFTFSDDAQMQQFGQLWQQHQELRIRMAVLQGYLNQEQAAVAQLNQKFLSDYNLDITKNYSLDTDRRVIVERPVAEQPAQQPTPQPATP